MRRRLPGLLFYICSIVVCRLAAAEETSYKPYLGQEPPGTTAVVFAPGVVSLPGRYEYALSVSPDGKEIVFSTEKPGESSKLMMTRHRQGGWTGPRLLQLTQGARKAEMEAFFGAYADDMAAAVEQDFPIWENKTYLERPRLCEGDGPVGDYRRWAAQFYVEKGAETE